MNFSSRVCKGHMFSQCKTKDKGGASSTSYLALTNVVSKYLTKTHIKRVQNYIKTFMFKD